MALMMSAGKQASTRNENAQIFVFFVAKFQRREGKRRKIYANK